MKKAAVLLLIVLSALSASTAIAETYGGGTGDPNDPFQIRTAEHLDSVGANYNDWNDHFILTADIDKSGYTYNTAVIAPDTNQLPYRFQGWSFNCSFGNL